MSAQVTSQTESMATPLAVTNLFVGLKSKPLTLVVGPKDTGKIAAVQNIANLLIGDDPFRFQKMVGHAWWADQTTNITQFTEAQTRWNSSKVIELIHEAGQPDNSERIYLGFLTRISPAELNEFFSEVAFQLKHDQVMRVSSIHLSTPMPFPSNMFLIGTMDNNQFKWMDEDLVSKTSLIHWLPDGNNPPDLPSGQPDDINVEKKFLKSCLRNAQSAYQRLYSLLKSQKQPIWPLFETIKVLQKHKIFLPNSMIQSAMIYIANSWSTNGTGLFSKNDSKNLAVALDFAIAQTYLLPIEDKLLNSAALRKSLQALFQGRFPQSSILLTNLV